MKTILISIIMIMNTSMGYSQILEIYEEIKDGVNAASMEIIAGLEQVTNAEQDKEMETDSKKTKSLLEQKKSLEEIKEITQQISEAFKSYSTIKNAFIYLKETLNLYVRLCNKMKEKTSNDGSSMFTSEDITRLNNIFFQSVVQQKESIKNIKLIIDKDKSKMSEGQRIKLLYKEESNMKNTYMRLREYEKLMNINLINH